MREQRRQSRPEGAKRGKGSSNMLNISNELKAKLLAAQGAEEAAALVKADGQEITPEDAAHLWEEIKKGKEQDGRELSRDELEAVSGGADRNWVTGGRTGTVEYGSWCDSNDDCIVWDVTYDFQPTGHLCPNCGKNMYKQNTISLGGDEYEDQYRCKHCGCITRETYYDRAAYAK